MPILNSVGKILIVFSLLITLADISLGQTTANFLRDPQPVRFVEDRRNKTVNIFIGETFFTSLLYSDLAEKPILYPLMSPNGKIVTRQFPLQENDGERIDHPHQVGMWFNYERVNGLDFWNNSYAIPENRKSQYGWIRSVKIKQARASKRSGGILYTANWERQNNKVILTEETEFLFFGNAKIRVVDRTTKLTAVEDTVIFEDVKDGLMALRVATELEVPSDKLDDFTSASGKIYISSSVVNGANGSYLSSAGKQDNNVWGTRAEWVMLSGRIDNHPVSIIMIDHPKNPGYPTYWHAREYGLFAANPLGQKIFSNGRETMSLRLKAGESCTFRYRVAIYSGERPSSEIINEIAKRFSEQ